METIIGYKSKLLIFAISILAVATCLQAHIVDFDEVWKEREEKARATALEAYHPNPFEVNSHLNMEVHKSLENNGTRRYLRHYNGLCLATNPIDRCWRCQRDWATNRQKLADCPLGFGRNTRGGKFGKIYTVTDSSDNDMVNPKYGTLRWGVIQKKPLWIIFARDMFIRLNQELIINSDKTIDGRGATVHIAWGAGFTIQFAKNVIIHGLHFHDIVSGNGGMIRDSTEHFGLRGVSDGDAISIFGSSHVWIDHNSLSNSKDGLIDAIHGSTALTISNNHFTHHNDVILMGASDSYSEDSIMQATFAFNHFGRGLVQRMPRCRWGFFHVVNNDYTHWLMYAVGGSTHPTIISQGNRYIAPSLYYAKEVTKRDYAPESEWKTWSWTSEGDLMRNGAYFRQSGIAGLALKNRSFTRGDMIKAKPGSFVPRLTRFSGVLSCKEGVPC